MSIRLRPFKLEDAPAVALLVGDKEVSKWTSNIPFPYSEQNAIDWIKDASSCPEKYPFAVELDGKLVACVSYWPHESGGVEVGYWVGKQYWSRGVCTEALTLLLNNRRFPADSNVYARVMAPNVGSQRVLEKCGFSFLGNGVICKDGQEMESILYIREAIA